MKIVILGVKGMLGRDLDAASRAAGLDVTGFDLPEMDITRDGAFDAISPCDWVVNCAAYTNVDGAESHPDLAFAVNARAVGRLGAWCASWRVPLLHISTDYVFDGTAARPYTEADAPHPLNVYGASKLAGEKALQAAGGRHLIVRTQSLFGVHGKNFVKAICGRLAQGQPLRVVTDQVSSPTYTAHLAAAILHLMRTPRHGIVHVSATGECSWHAFACAIVRQVSPGTRVERVTSAEFASAARRPPYSVLDKTRYEAWTGHAMPGWEEGLSAYLEDARRGEATPTEA